MRTYRLSDLYSDLAHTDEAAGRAAITEHDDGTVEVRSAWLPSPKGRDLHHQKRVRIGSHSLAIALRERTGGEAPDAWHILADFGAEELGLKAPICRGTRLLAALGIATRRSMHSDVSA